MSPWPVLLSLCLLSACATAPTRYYSLASVDDSVRAEASAASSRTEASDTGDAARGLRLEVVEVPAQVDRLQLVVQAPRRDPANEVQVLNESLWSAALENQLQAVLSSRVSAGLGLIDLQKLPLAAHLPARTIEVRLTRFDMVWGQFSQMTATWVDQAPDRDAPYICEADIQVPAGSSVAELVQSQRQATGILSELIIHTAMGLTTAVQDYLLVSKFGCA